MTVEERVAITVTLSRSVVDRVGDAARRAERTVEDEIGWLVEGGLEAEMSIEEMLAKTRHAYRSRYERMGKRAPTSEELRMQMDRIREEVANELYPD